MMRFGYKILILLFFMAVSAVPLKPASNLGLSYNVALAGCGSDCNTEEHEKLRGVMENENLKLKKLISDLFMEYQQWFMNAFFDNYIAPSLVLMAEQLSELAYRQMFILGTFFDAQQQIKTERVLQELQAEAHKRYRPSEEMCRMGTMVRGMAEAEQAGRYVPIELAEESRNRQLAYRDSISAQGIQIDRSSRFDKFTETYCDPSHADGDFAEICGGGGPQGRRNKDMHYAKTVGNPLTLRGADFKDSSSTADEEDLIALQRNLYGHDLFVQVTEAVLDNPNNHTDYLDARAIVAKRSVLENSFWSIAGLKSPGNAAGGGDSPMGGHFVINELENWEILREDIVHLVGENPSYYALLDILSQKIYFEPQAFAELYTSPANVKRKMVAMQAVDLMRDRETFKSELRYESMLALWLELKITDYQRAVAGRLDWVQERRD